MEARNQRVLYVSPHDLLLYARGLCAEEITIKDINDSHPVNNADVVIYINKEKNESKILKFKDNG